MHGQVGSGYQYFEGFWVWQIYPGQRTGGRVVDYCHTSVAEPSVVGLLLRQTIPRPAPLARSAISLSSDSPSDNQVSVMTPKVQSSSSKQSTKESILGQRDRALVLIMLNGLLMCLFSPDSDSRSCPVAGLSSSSSSSDSSSRRSSSCPSSWQIYGP